MTLQVKVTRELSLHWSVYCKHNPSKEKINMIYLPGQIQAPAKVVCVCGSLI